VWYAAPGAEYIHCSVEAAYEPKPGSKFERYDLRRIDVSAGTAEYFKGITHNPEDDDDMYPLYHESDDIIDEAEYRRFKLFQVDI
jgi:hypothetical protein